MSYGESFYIIWGGSSCVTYAKSSYITDVLVFSVSPVTAMSIKQLPLCATCQCHHHICVGVFCVTTRSVLVFCVTLTVMSIKQLPLCATCQCHHQICVGVLCVTPNMPVSPPVLCWCSVSPLSCAHKTTATKRCQSTILVVLHVVQSVTST